MSKPPTNPSGVRRPSGKRGSRRLFVLPVQRYGQEAVNPLRALLRSWQDHVAGVKEKRMNDVRAGLRHTDDKAPFDPSRDLPFFAR